MEVDGAVALLKALSETPYEPATIVLDADTEMILLHVISLRFGGWPLAVDVGFSVLVVPVLYPRWKRPLVALLALPHPITIRYPGAVVVITGLTVPIVVPVVAGSVIVID